MHYYKLPQIILGNKEVYISKKKINKKNYPTIWQNNNKDSSFIITGNIHGGLTHVRPHSKNFTSIFSFIHHNKLLRLLWWYAIDEESKVRRVDVTCELVVQLGLKPAQFTCGRGPCGLSRCSKLTRSPDRAEALCLLVWPTRLPLLFDCKTLLTLCPT